MFKTKETEKSFYEILITELPIIFTFSVFIVFRTLYPQLSVVEILVFLFILLPFLAIARFTTINLISKRKIDNLKLIHYLAFSGIPSYSATFLATLLITQTIFGEITLPKIVLITTTFLSATTVLSLLSLGIFIDKYFDPRRSKKGIDIVKTSVIITILSSISSIALIFSIVLMNTYLKTNFSILELITLNTIVAISVYANLKKIYSTIEKDITKIRNLLSETNDNFSEKKDIEMHSEELKELQKVIQQVEEDYKLKESIIKKITNNSIEKLQKIKENLSTLLETIDKYQKSKNIEITSLRYSMKEIVRNLENSIESLNNTQPELNKLKRDEESNYTKGIMKHISAKMEEKTKILETLNSVQENLRKAQDNFSILYRDIPNLINNTDKLYNLVEEIRNVSLKLNNLSIALDIELAKTKYENQKLSVISREIRRISETILKTLSTIKFSEVEKHKTITNVSLLLASFSSLESNIKELIKITNEYLENTKKSLANIRSISERFSIITSSISTIEEEINLITSSLLKLHLILPESEKEISSFYDSMKKILESISALKTEIEGKTKEIEDITKELKL